MPADPKRVRDLFLAAAEVPPEARPSYLAEVCGPNAELRAEVERLLAAHDQPASVLEAQAPHVPDRPDPLTATYGHSPATEDNTPRHDAGAVIAGKYKLVEEIGEGGMGTVWMATQSEPVKRLVAVKLIKPGMDSRTVLARFEAERQALALMDHPNIAKVFDGGTDRGQPFFVMELVKGVQLTDYCDERRLTVRERLGLLVQVCSAVQHAHTKGVIHRDLKPSNVLVTEHDGKPVPKVIDFGLAKALHATSLLTDRTLHTSFGAVVGTPLYMAPEQVGINALDVDTRTDVYALGVILYEMLTGTTPLEKHRLKEAVWDEVRRLIREDEPPKPSTRLSTSDALPAIAARRHVEPAKLSRLVRGELDWIVMKALEKDRTRRYETASGLALDVQRFLGGEPVQAVPPSVGYRLRKFVQRHRGPVAAVAVVLLAVVAGAATATWQAVRATTAEREAVVNARDATAAKEEADHNATVAAEAAGKSTHLAEQRRVDIYPPRVKLAWQYWSDGDLVRMREVLDSLRPAAGQVDLRGFEWHYLWRLAHHRNQTLHHPHPVRAVAAAPDGKTVATAGAGSGEVWVWDAATGAVRLRLDAGGPVLAVAYAPDGSAVAAAGEDGTVRTWDPRTGEARLTLTGAGKPLGSLAYSADGSRLAAAVGGWTLKTGTPVTRFLPAGYEKPGPITVWDARTGQPVADLPGHPRFTLCLAFSPDGLSLASGGADGTLRVWDVAAGKQRFQVADDQGGVFAVAYTPDGRALVSAGWHMTVRVRESGKGALSRVLSGPTAPVLAVAVSPDGREALTAGFDRLVRRWDLATGRETGRILGHSLAATGLAADAGWRTVYTAGWDGDVHAWPADQPQECDRLGRAGRGGVPSYHVTFSPDSATLAASGSSEMVLYDTATRREVRALPTSDRDLTTAFSPDGKLLAGVGINGTIHRWDTATWSALPPIAAHAVKIWGLAFAPDGRTLATAAGQYNKPGKVKLWDPVSGEELAAHDPRSDTVRTIAFTPDGRTLLYGVGGRIGRLDVTSRSDLPPLPGEYHVAFSPDGATAALGQPSPIPNMVEMLLWDVPAGRPRARLRGHTADIYQVVFAPDGKTVATASWDGSIKLWHVATGEELLVFRRQAGVVWSVAFAPNGQYMAVGAGNLGIRELTLWDARPPGAPAGQPAPPPQPPR